MTKTVIRLNEDELKGMIKNILKENIENGNLDEGFWGSLGGLASGLKGKASTAANMAGQGLRKAGQAVANTAKNVGNKVADTAKSAGQAVSKQVGDLKQSMNAGSDEEDFKKAYQMLSQWAQKGYFGDSRQTASRISGLKNAMIMNFKQKYGKDLTM